MPAALTANWINPLLFSWPVDDAVLEPLLPSGLVIDHWQGRAYISLVGLRFEGLRVFGVPVLPRRYDEVNLRFYVRRPGDGDEERPGVVFIRQIVPHRLTALAAQVMYGEPFTVARTGHEFEGIGGRRIGFTPAYCLLLAGRRPAATILGRVRPKADIRQSRLAGGVSHRSLLGLQWENRGRRQNVPFDEAGVAGAAGVSVGNRL